MSDDLVPSTPDAPATGPTWTHHDDLIPFSPAPGVTPRALPAGAEMVAWIAIEPNTTLALHHHPNQQIGVVLEGAVAITIAGDTRRLGPGHAYTVPPNLPHAGVTGPDGYLVLETFAPPRTDYLAMARAAAERGPGAQD